MSSTPVSPAFYSQTHQAGVSSCQAAWGDVAAPALAANPAGLAVSGRGQAKGSAPWAAYGSFHPHRALRAGDRLLGSALPRGDIPTVTG